MKSWARRFALVAAVAGVALAAPAGAQAGLIKKVTFPPGIESGTARWSWQNSGFVVGNYFSGWTFYAYGSPYRGFRWGWLGGDIRSCVWVYEGNLPAGGTSTTEMRCGPPRDEPFQASLPGYGLSFAPRIVWSNEPTLPGTDGAPATLDPRRCGGSTRRYANALPWLASTQFIRPMGDFLTAPRPVYKRYLSRAGNDAVLVHDPELGSTGNYPSPWFFVPSACVT
jgi:hypothetical protein